MIRRTFFILILALGATSVYAISRPELDSLYSNFHLEEVEVTARALTKDVIVPQTLKGAQLERLNALNVADALRYFSGVQLKDYGGVGGIKTINVRSMGSQHTAVYYNGVQLGNAQNGQVDLGRFSLDNMEQIQLYKGQKSDIFQSAREFGSAGNVYLTTRRPYFKDKERVHVRAQMRCGSFAIANRDPSRNNYKENARWDAQTQTCVLRDAHASGAYRLPNELDEARVGAGDVWNRHEHAFAAAADDEDKPA